MMMKPEGNGGLDKVILIAIVICWIIIWLACNLAKSLMYLNLF